METQTSVHTKRLELRPITPAFIHHLFSNETQEEIIKFFGHDDKGFERLKTMHEGGMETYRLSLYYFLIIEKESQLPIGECGFHIWDKVHHKAELFYLLRHDAVKQKGYMTEALQAAIAFGFSDLQLHRIEALVSNSNTPSAKLVQRFGFTKEGSKREDYLLGAKHEDSDFYALYTIGIHRLLQRRPSKAGLKRKQHIKQVFWQKKVYRPFLVKGF